MSKVTDHKAPPADDALKLFQAVWGAHGFGATGAAPAPAKASRFLALPRRVCWLNGAPGAGKGTHTPVIQRELGITAPPVVVSDLLKSPEARALIDAGKLVGDREVASLLLERLSSEDLAGGAIVDGFPRTAAQAGFLKHLHARLAEHRAAALAAGNAGNTSVALPPLPEFRICVLLVDEDESVRRQLQRGREAAAAGQGVRKTDTDEALARERYRVFMEQTVEPLRALSAGGFPYHEINTFGEKPEVAGRIAGALAAK